MDSTAIPLPAVMDINACGALQSTLLEHITVQDDITLDSSAVERISTPGIQFLLSLIKTMGTNGKKLRITSPTSTLIQAVDDLGLNLAFNVIFRDTVADGKERI